MFILAIFLPYVWMEGIGGMIRGEDASYTAYPWLAGLLNEEWRPRCSGTVVSKFFVLTASACLIHKISNGTWDLIDPKQFIVVVPAEPPLLTVKEIQVLMVHPKLSNGSMYNAGLIGIWPSLTLKYGMVLPLWTGNASRLRAQMDYVLQTIDSFRCFLVTWRDPPHRSHGGAHPPYKVRQISMMEVRPYHQTVCENHFCLGNKSRSTSCLEKLNGTMCLTILMPRDSELCGSDRGAGLFCSQFLWGVLIGGASCTNSDPMPISLRIDAVADFILENYEIPFRKEASKSPLFEPKHPLFILVALQYIICKTIGAIRQ